MKVQRTKNTGVPCLEQGTRGRAAAIRVLAEFSTEDELELADAEKARTAVGAPGFPPNSGTTTHAATRLVRLS